MDCVVDVRIKGLPSLKIIKLRSVEDVRGVVFLELLGPEGSEKTPWHGKARLGRLVCIDEVKFRGGETRKSNIAAADYKYTKSNLFRQSLFLRCGSHVISPDIATGSRERP
jgi:hypothetical protein